MLLSINILQGKTPDYEDYFTQETVSAEEQMYIN